MALLSTRFVSALSLALLTSLHNVTPVFAQSAPQKMQISNECHANALEACFIIASGPIDAGAPARLAKLIEEGAEAFQVLLNSPGGDLAAGLELGRIIRKHEYQTRIGTYQDKDFPLPGECLSACAYAFLGGTQRLIRDGSRIGFHQFAPGNGRDLPGQGGLIAGQQVSAILISYIVEMGVDARLFSVASETAFSDMLYPSEDVLRDYDVVTPTGFGNFVMEPYGNGVIAASKRLGPTHAYDRVDHLTVFCRKSRLHFLLTVTEGGRYMPDTEGANAQIWTSAVSEPTNDQRRDVDINTSNIRIWTNENNGYIQLSVDPGALRLGDDQRLLGASLYVSRAAGGYYGAVVELSEMDLRMLRTVSRLCI